MTTRPRGRCTGCDLRRPDDDRYRAYKLDVLRVVEGLVVETTTFDAQRFEAFGLPELWSEDLRAGGIDAGAEGGTS